MVDIILTDTKNKEKFLKLPLIEQRKKGITLIIFGLGFYGMIP